MKNIKIKNGEYKMNIQQRYNKMIKRKDKIKREKMSVSEHGV